MKSIRALAGDKEGYLMTLPFLLGAVMLNIQFILGLTYQPNLLYTALNVVAAALALVWACWSLPGVWSWESRKLFVWSGLILLFFAVCYAVAVLRFGLQPGIVQQGRDFVLYCPLALLIGMLAGIKRNELDFFDCGEVLCLLAIPLGLHYVFMTYMNINPYGGGGIGIVDYQQLSYLYMPLLFVMTIQLARGRKSMLAGVRAANAVRVFCILLYWLLILGCGTRGAMVGALVFFAVLPLYMVLTRSRFMKAVAVGCGILSLFLIFSYAVRLPGLQRLSRMNTLTSNLAEGELTSSRDAPNVKKVDLDTVVQDDDGGKKYNFIIGETVKNRTTIFTLAWKEAKKRPLTGMGPFGFTVKYGSYPHNIALELLSELGFIAGGLVLLFIAYCFIRLLVLGFRDHAMGLMFVFLCGYAVQLMVSGTVWARPVLLFGIAYSLCHAPVTRKGILPAKAREAEEN